MSYDAKEAAWIGADNEVEWVIFSDGQPLVSLTALTRAVVCFGDARLDSDASPDDVWWTDTVTDRELKSGALFTGNVLRARLGQTQDLRADEYEAVRLIVYDEDHPHGLVVSDSIYVSVRSSCG